MTQDLKWGSQTFQNLISSFKKERTTTQGTGSMIRNGPSSIMIILNQPKGPHPLTAEAAVDTGQSPSNTDLISITGRHQHRSILYISQLPMNQCTMQIPMSAITSHLIILLLHQILSLAKMYMKLLTQQPRPSRK